LIVSCATRKEGEGECAEFHLEGSMLTALVLVCSLGTTPDLATCNKDSAADVLRVPEEFANPATCFMHGQAYLAQTELGRGLAKGYQVKIVCVRSQSVGTTAGAVVAR
jgi:hypothetical protein